MSEIRETNLTASAELMAEAALKILRQNKRIQELEIENIKLKAEIERLNKSIDQVIDNKFEPDKWPLYVRDRMALTLRESRQKNGWNQ